MANGSKTAVINRESMKHGFITNSPWLSHIHVFHQSHFFSIFLSSLAYSGVFLFVIFSEKKNDFWLRDIVKETTQSNVHFMSVWCNLGWLSFGPRNFHYINSGKNLFAYHRSIETRRWWHIVFWWQTKMARSHRNTQQAKPATTCALTSSSNARIRK